MNTKHRNTTNIRLAAAVLLALGATMPGAHAQTWAKTGSPGNLPMTAQVTLGAGALQQITGAFSFTTTGTERTVANVSNPDLFQIYINGNSPFSATTLGQDSNVFNPQLFLFNSAGYGVYANDDASNFTTGALIAPTVALTPGLYFLGIAPYGVVARGGTGAASDIFDNTVDDTSGAVGFTGLKAARPGSGPLSNWFLSSADVETGFYGIALSGASYAAPNGAPVPEASTLASLGVPVLLGLLLVARRRRKVAPAPA